MRVAICALALLAVSACGWTSEQRAQVATAGPALDAAEVKIAACQQPEIRRGTEAMIEEARKVLPLAVDGSAGALKLLNDRLVLITVGLSKCSRIDQTAATYDQQCRGEVRLGMTREQVRKTLWCAPDVVNKTETARGTTEEWVYRGDEGIAGLQNRPKGALSFSGDTLTAIHRRE
jgi:hypothetical protein